MMKNTASRYLQAKLDDLNVPETADEVAAKWDRWCGVIERTAARKVAVRQLWLFTSGLI